MYVYIKNTAFYKTDWHSRVEKRFLKPNMQ